MNLSDDTKFMRDLNDLASDIHPDPAFARTLEAELRHAHRQSQQNKARNRYPIVFKSLSAVAAAIMFVTVATLAIPPLRSFAQAIIDSLFIRAESNQTTTESPLITPSSNLPTEPDYRPLNEVEAMADFDIKVPTYPFTGYTFKGAVYVPNFHTVTLAYEMDGRQLQIYQQPVEYIDEGLLIGWGVVGADTPVEQVQIGDITGEYVAGAWIQRETHIDETGQTVTTENEWLPSAPIRRLRWQENGILYEIAEFGGAHDDPDHPSNGRDEMVEIALSLE